MTNMMIMANQMNNMNQIPNNITQQLNGFCLKFLVNEGKSLIIPIQCQVTEKMGDIFERFWVKLGKKDPKAKFVHNAKNINPSLTVSECGFMNQDQIQVLMLGSLNGGL